LLSTQQTHPGLGGGAQGVAMADLVLGLAKSAVEGTLTAAKSAIEEEEKLKKGMQRDLMLISDEFEMMHSFLNVVVAAIEKVLKHNFGLSNYFKCKSLFQSILPSTTSKLG